MAREILVIAEQRSEKIRAESYELAGFGGEMAKIIGAELTGIISGSPVEFLAEEFAQKSGLKVIGLENQNLNPYNAEAYLKALVPLIQLRKPEYILISHTATGWDFAPRLAVAIPGSCSTGITGLAAEKPLSFVRKIWGGKILQEVAPVPGTTAVLTIMPGSGKPILAPGRGKVEIRRLKMKSPQTRNLGYVEAKRGTLDLSKAEVIVSVGRGIKSPEHLGLIEKLASLFDKSAIGASRPVVDAGWIPYEHQVGQTGQTVKPKLYLALGISGAIQHIIGMKNSELIIAINTDPNANIFQAAHLGIVQDLHQFLPVLIERIQQRKG